MSRTVCRYYRCLLWGVVRFVTLRRRRRRIGVYADVVGGNCAVVPVLVNLHVIRSRCQVVGRNPGERVAGPRNVVVVRNLVARTVRTVQPHPRIARTPSGLDHHVRCLAQREVVPIHVTYRINAGVVSRTVCRYYRCLLWGVVRFVTLRRRRRRIGVYADAVAGNCAVVTVLVYLHVIGPRSQTVTRDPRERVARPRNVVVVRNLVARTVRAVQPHPRVARTAGRLDHYVRGLAQRELHPVHVGSLVDAVGLR